MKKILTSIVFSTLLVSGVALAATLPVTNKTQFDSHPFNSAGPDDLVTVSNDDPNYIYTALIYVENSAAGVNINNCGTIKHIAPGSTALCTVAEGKPVTFSSDKQGARAFGSYQVDKK